MPAVNSSSKTVALFRRPIGLGAVATHMINGVPVPSGFKRAMAACGGCKRRAAKLDALVPNVNPFAQKSETPTHSL